MLTELFIRYFFGEKRQNLKAESSVYPPSEDRLDFLNTVVWLSIVAIYVWLLAKIL